MVWWVLKCESYAMLSTQLEIQGWFCAWCACLNTSGSKIKSTGEGIGVALGCAQTSLQLTVVQQLYRKSQSAPNCTKPPLHFEFEPLSPGQTCRVPWFTRNWNQTFFVTCAIKLLNLHMRFYHRFLSWLSELNAVSATWSGFWTPRCWIEDQQLYMHFFFGHVHV